MCKGEVLILEPQSNRSYTLPLSHFAVVTVVCPYKQTDSNELVVFRKSIAERGFGPWTSR